MTMTRRAGAPSNGPIELAPGIGHRHWRSSSVEYALVILLLGDILLPFVSIGSYGVSPSTLLAPAALALYLTMRGRQHAGPWWHVQIIVAMGGMVLWCSFWSYLVLGVTFNSGDLTEAVRYVRFLPYLLLLQFARLAYFEQALWKGVSLAALWVILVGLLQTTQWGWLGMKATEMYAGEHHLSNVALGGGRVVLTGSDPNVGAAIGVYLLLIHYVLFVRRGSLWSLMLVGGLGAVILLTQSRTGILGAGLVILIHGAFVIRSTLVKKVALVFLVTSAAYAVYSIAIVDRLEYVTGGFSLLLEGADESANARLEQFGRSVDLFSGSPLFGWGPAKAMGRELVDPEYAWILGHYGVLGVSLFVMYITFYLRSASRVMRYAGQLAPLGAEAGVLCMLFALIVMATNFVFSGAQLFAVLILLSMSTRLFEVEVRKHWNLIRAGRS